MIKREKSCDKMGDGGAVVNSFAHFNPMRHRFSCLVIALCETHIVGFSSPKTEINSGGLSSPLLSFSWYCELSFGLLSLH